MSGWEAVLLGFVQGATEFLPVSSSGHLVIGQAVLGIEVTGVLFEVAVHLATLVSIAWVYRKRLLGLVRGVATGDRAALEYVGLLAVATVPAGLIGALGRDAIAGLFDDPRVPGVALLVTGAVLWSSRAALERPSGVRPGIGVALLVGIAQAFALVPGISRSGATVVAGLWLGVEAREAAAFSFLMAMPAIAGAAALQVLDGGVAASGLPTSVLIAGGAVAAVTGVLAIRTFVAMLGRRAFHFFAPYCWAVGVLYLLWLGAR